MAVSNVSFASQVEEWVRDTEKRMIAVFRTSASMVIKDMQKTRFEGGLNRIDTGAHLASMQVGINTPPQDAIKKATGKPSAPFNMGAVDAVIAGAEIGDTIVASYGMAYSLRLEYGFEGTDSLGRKYNQKPYAFVRTAAQRWPQIVEKATELAKARSAARNK
ncbi:HK97 gp10 family phage protein [Phyllobacterium chamaecytisi]|uniref:HK97 gp10 family phage protein n=1 Tax=Phyllobacterium chamaecytisi TaxID=2876082 RepID=UPI001CCC2A91|nr:HK97 gp10 family phage protein [Phyllobacterium sp. KW56]MBZ9600752.1 HK97 gp10 family phage protein [Phyllobacterium sp. KW56]